MWSVVESPADLFDAGDDPRCYFGRRFVAWAFDARLGGYAASGYPDGEDAAEFVRVLDLGRAWERRTSSLILDFRELTGIHPDAFERVRAYLLGGAELVHPDSVIVRPAGMLGAVVAGFHSVVGDRQKPVVGSLADACRHHAREDAIAPLEALARLRDVGGLVDQLRGLLASDLAPASVDDVAAALALSPRTLQDHLRRAGTTFRDELATARLARAKRLVDAHVKLTAVAHEVGFSSSQQFATWFKRHVGQTPSEWRRRPR
jgi:AraC-like DNA-binding protein